MVVSLVVCYLFAFTLGLDFYGLIFGMIITQVICVGLYFSLWKFGSGWKTYWARCNVKDMKIESNYSVPLLKRAGSIIQATPQRSQLVQSIVQNYANKSMNKDESTDLQQKLVL
jgi:hypothetical protein